LFRTECDEPPIRRVAYDPSRARQWPPSRRGLIEVDVCRLPVREDHHRAVGERPEHGYHPLLSRDLVGVLGIEQPLQRETALTEVLAEPLLGAFGIACTQEFDELQVRSISFRVAE
jgi:hypothetical protein